MAGLSELKYVRLYIWRQSFRGTYCRRTYYDAWC